MAKQAPLLVEVNSLVRDWGVESPFALPEGPIGPTGYAGVEVDVDNELILVFWKYAVAVPPSVMTRLQEIEGRGVRVDLLKAPFSLVDLRDEYRLSVLAFNAEGIQLTRIGPSRGALGLQIGTDEPERVLASSAYQGAVKRLKAKSKRPPENPIPVSLSPQYVPIRTADRSPYWGGALIANAGSGGLCSSGFAVGNLWGKYLATAGHCSSHSNGVFFRNGQGLTTGSTTGAQANDPGTLDRIDTILVSNLLNCTAPNSVCNVPGSAQPRLYNGDVLPNGLTGPGGFSRIVKDRTVSVPGMIVCTSGAFSGDRCDIEVVAIEQRILAGLVFARGTVQTRHRAGESGGGNGDSGGPVFTVRGTTNEANAAGILVSAAIMFGIPCTGVPAGGGRQCSSEINYQTIQDVTRALDVWLEVQ